MVILLHTKKRLRSQPTRAAWIEIVKVNSLPVYRNSRSPLGLRGLKLFISLARAVASCRSPLGLRGLKFVCMRHLLWLFCRSPLGLRGLKFAFACGLWLVYLSQPTRAAWIEI